MNFYLDDTNEQSLSEDKGVEEVFLRTTLYSDTRVEAVDCQGLGHPHSRVQA